MYLMQKLIKNKGITYLYLMQSVYDPLTKQTKKKIIENFGNLDTFIKEHPEKYNELKKLYGSSKEKFKAEKEKTINNFFKDLGDGNSEDKLLQNFGSLISQNYAHLTLRKLWNEELQMSKFLDYLKSYEGLEFQYDLSEIALYFTVLKIISPCSYRLTELIQSSKEEKRFFFMIAPTVILKHRVTTHIGSKRKHKDCFGEG